MFRVLLVDDEELALISLRYSIPWKEYGFSDVQISQDAESALQSLCKGRIDAAFVDIRMPGLSGLELMQAARENGTETLFVVVSGYADFAYAQEAIRQGVLDYCLKPVDPEETIPILKQLSEQLLSRRLTKDPQEILKLLSDEEFCHHFLKAILPDSQEEPLPMLRIRTPQLQEALSQLCSSSPAPDTFLLNQQEAFLVWGTPPQALDDFLGKYERQALLACRYFKPTAASFQSELKRMWTEWESCGESDTGILQAIPFSDRMNECFNRLLVYVENNYPHDLNLQELSRQFGINYTYLSQMFHKTIGKPFSKYLTELRLKHACELLSQSDMKVTQIAETVGYNDYHYFNNVFKRQFHMTPLQYRGNQKGEKGVCDSLNS